MRKKKKRTSSEAEGRKFEKMECKRLVAICIYNYIYFMAYRSCY